MFRSCSKTKSNPSVFASTALCSQMRKMVGPVRFVNHSCKPNCKYVISEFKNRKNVRLEVLKDIAPHSELNAYYRPNFFENGNSSCKCPHTQYHRSVPSLACPRGFPISQQIKLESGSKFRFEDRRFRLNRSNGSMKKRKKKCEIRDERAGFRQLRGEQ